jgi:hypothetical protein
MTAKPLTTKLSDSNFQLPIAPALHPPLHLHMLIRTLPHARNHGPLQGRVRTPSSPSPPPRCPRGTHQPAKDSKERGRSTQQPRKKTQTDISSLVSREHSPLGIFWKLARIGERLSPYVSICCVLMAVRPVPPLTSPGNTSADSGLILE